MQKLNFGFNPNFRLRFLANYFSILSVLLILLASLLTACGGTALTESNSNQAVASTPDTTRSTTATTQTQAVTTTTAATSLATTSASNQFQIELPSEGCLPELKIPSDFSGDLTQACVDNPLPKQYTNVNLLARVIVGGKPLQGVKAEAKWDFKYIDYSCRNLVTDKRGIVRCGYAIANATKKTEVKITVNFITNNGQKYFATTSFITEGTVAPATAIPVSFTSVNSIASQQAQPEPTQQIELTATAVPPTATATPKPVATATPAPPTATPKPAPTATPAPLNVDFVTVDGGRPGSHANVTISTQSGATCSIFYRTPLGTSSKAAGLDDKQTNGSGNVSWSWLIGGNTRPGTGTVSVRCTAPDGRSGSASSPITIG